MQGHQLRQRLTHAAKQWEETGRDPSAVYRGARLSAALEWASTRGRDLNELERDFLGASRQASARQAERRRKTNRRLRGLLAGTTASLLVLAGGLALVQRVQDLAERTEKQARIASARELAAAAVANLDVDPERSILLALEAVDATWEADRTVEPEAEEALHRALRRSRVVLSVPQGAGLAVSADGIRFGTTGQDGTAIVWDTETGERLLTLRGHDGAVNGIAFSPDGNRLATAGSDGTVRLWDGASGRQIQVLRGHKGPVWTPAYSPNGRLLATTGQDTTIRIWDVRTGREEMVLTGPADETIGRLFLPVRPVFSPDGSRLAIARWDGSTRIWDLTTGETVVVLGNHIWEATDVAFSGNGRRVVTSSLDGTARIWDARSGDRLITLSGHTGEVHAVDYSPDGGRIATGGVDGTTLVWDAVTGEQIMALSGQTKEVRRVAFTPDGDRLFTASADGTTRLWDVSVGGGRDWLTVPGPSRRLGGLAFNPDGRTFAVPRDPAGVTIRDVDTGAQVITLTDHDATVWDMDFSPDGSRLAAVAGTGKGNPGANRTLPIWDVNTGKLVMTLMGHGGGLAAVAFSPDGRRLVATSYDGTLRVWDAATGKQRRVVKVGAHGHGLGFSPDGRWLLASIGDEGIVAVFDAATLERRGELRGHTDYIQDIEFGPDGRVVTASRDGTAKIWDLSSRREVATLRVPTGAVLSVAVSPDGDLIATASADGTVKLWDAATGREWLTLFGHNRTVYSAAFSPDGRLFATASVDGTVALYLLPIDELRELARDRVTRTLTDEECREYLHMEKCPAGI